MRAIRNIASGVNTQIDDYLESLQDLRQSLLDDSTVQATIKIYQVFDEVEAMREVIDDLGLTSSTYSHVLSLIL